MAITPDELDKLNKELEIALDNKDSYEAFKRENFTVNSTRDVVQAYCIRLFEKFNLFDVIAAESGMLNNGPDDTHYRGRVMEKALNGHFDGRPEKDFPWGELKCAETKSNSSTELQQIITCGVIFTAVRKPEYNIVTDYYKSHFFTKMEDTLLITYFKDGRLGKEVNNVCTFSIRDPRWASRLKEDWESIRDEIILAIEGERNGTVVRKRSGICKSDSGTGPRSKSRRPNGLLGIRNDSVIITPQFFREIISAQ